MAENRQILIKLANFCAYQDRSKVEVLKKMKELETPENEIDKMLAFLEKEKYWNEKRFVHSFVRGKFRFKSWGKKKIMYELKAHLIPENMVWDAFDAEISDEEYNTKIAELIDKKRREIAKDSPQTQKEKITRFLLQKGYDWADIAALLR
jgi:regulatory protein